MTTTGRMSLSVSSTDCDGVSSVSSGSCSSSSSARGAGGACRTAGGDVIQKSVMGKKQYSKLATRSVGHDCKEAYDTLSSLLLDYKLGEIGIVSNPSTAVPHGGY